VANEKDIFSAQGAILRDQNLPAPFRKKPHLQEQIEANSEQGNAGKKQLDLIRQQIDRYEKLLKQGLATQNNDFQFRVLAANQEANIWRLLSDVSRLQMQSGESSTSYPFYFFFFILFKIQESKPHSSGRSRQNCRKTRDRLNELEVTLPAAVRIRDVKLQYAGGARLRAANI